jgi:hypothetical protein
MNRVRRTTLVMTAAALSVTALAGSAQAQTVLREDVGRFRSPQRWAIELRVGPYSPEIDSEFDGPEKPPHVKYFGTERRPLLQVELDWQFLRLFGTLGLGVQAGWFRERTDALTELDKESGDGTSLTLIPTSLQLVYRLDEGARRLNIPVVPYAKAGLSYTIWRITDANGDTAKFEGKSGLGGTPGWQAAVGVALLLDFIDPASARALDSETGVNHTYAFFEYARYDATGLGSKKVLRVGDTTWLAGLMFEF